VISFFLPKIKRLFFPENQNPNPKTPKTQKKMQFFLFVLLGLVTQHAFVAATEETFIELTLESQLDDPALLRQLHSRKNMGFGWPRQGNLDLAYTWKNLTFVGPTDPREGLRFHAPHGDLRCQFSLPLKQGQSLEDLVIKATMSRQKDLLHSSARQAAAIYTSDLLVWTEAAHAVDYVPEGPRYWLSWCAGPVAQEVVTQRLYLLESGDVLSIERNVNVL
jgi:hypothetical protein